MYAFLEKGGKLVTVSSKHWEFGSELICVNFRRWLEGVGAVVEAVDRGAFKESGTMVESNIIIINKR